MAYQPKSEAANPDFYFTTPDLTSMKVTMKDSPGVLNVALSILSKNSVNMTRIESKPNHVMKDGLAHNFYFDVSGNQNDENIQNAMKDL